MTGLRPIVLIVGPKLFIEPGSTFLLLQILENDIITALAADLLVQWTTLAELQKVSPGKLRRFFYGHNRRQEKKILERLALINQAKP